MTDIINFIIDNDPTIISRIMIIHLFHSIAHNKYDEWNLHDRDTVHKDSHTKFLMIYGSLS